MTGVGMHMQLLIGIRIYLSIQICIYSVGERKSLLEHVSFSAECVFFRSRLNHIWGEGCRFLLSVYFSASPSVICSLEMLIKFLHRS